MDDFTNSDYIKNLEKTTLIMDNEWHKTLNANDPQNIKELLLKRFPDRKKHKRARALVEVVCNQGFKAENSRVAFKLWKSIKKSDYQRDSAKYLESIKNLCNKTVRSRLNKVGYTVTFHSSFTEIAKLK